MSPDLIRACKQVVLVDHMIECIHSGYTGCLLPPAPDVTTLDNDSLLSLAKAVLKDTAFTLNGFKHLQQNAVREILRNSCYYEHKAVVEAHAQSPTASSNVVYLRSIQ